VKKPLQPITPQLIAKCFGKGTRSKRSGSNWKVTTPFGGCVTVTPGGVKEIVGDDRVFLGVVSITHALFGTVQVSGGSPEFRRAMIEAGNKLNIPVEPTVNSSPNLAGFFWFAVVNLTDIFWIAKGEWGFVPIAGLLSILAFFTFRWMAKRAAKQEYENMLYAEGFIYPRHRPGDEFASEDDFENAGI
jgi:hypothetical protein